MRKKLIWLMLFLSLSLSSSLFAQSNNTLKGSVVDNNNRNLNVFNVTIHEVKDSTYLVGRICEDGKLLVTHTLLGDYLIRISLLGYQEKYIAANLQDTTDIGTVMLSLMSYDLDGITVTANANIVRADKGAYIIQVANTPLENLNSATEILRRAPGVQMIQGSLSVFGRGAPVIYIDGRQVHSMVEVEILKPTDILSFRIDRNPSAKYGASTTSVIEIKTNRKLEDRVAVQLSNESIFARNYSNRSGIGVNYNTKKTKSFLSYTYSDSKNKDYDESYDYNTLPDYSLSNTTTGYDKYSRKNHNALLGTSIMLNDKNELSMQYMFGYNDRDSDSNNRQTILKDQNIDQELDILENKRSHSPLHVANITYQLTPNTNSKFIISTDYSHSSTKGDQEIDEHNILNGFEWNKNLHNDNKSNIFVVRSEYTREIFNNYDLLLGVRFGHIELSSTLDFVDHSDSNNNYFDKYNIADNIIASYFTLTRDYDKIGYELGLRYEASKNHSKINGNIIRDRWEHDLFPSFSIYSNEWLDNFDLAFNYTNKISRPTINQLNPSLNYINNLTYSSGNPLLKPTKTHYLSLDATLYDKLSFSVSYSYDKNPIVQTGINDEINPDILIFKPINISKSYNWDFGVSYNNRWKWYSINVSTGLEMPTVKIPILDKIEKRDDKSWYLNFSNDFRLSKSTYASVSFDYASRWIDLATMFEPQYDLSFSITQFLCNRKIALTVGASDLFRRSYSDWEDRYANIITGLRTNKDSRYYSFKIRFNFNRLQNRYKQRSVSDDEQRRVR